MKTLVPALVKLTQKVNDLSLPEKAKDAAKPKPKSEKKPAPKEKPSAKTEKVNKSNREAEAPAKLDLPPFPKKVKAKETK